MNFVPLLSVDNIRFDISQRELVSAIGQPIRRSQNRLGEEQLHYAECVCRFDCAGLVEISRNVNSLMLAGATIRFEELPAFLNANDEEAETIVGFWVSPRYGIAVDPAFESWVTFMPSRRIAAWREIASNG